jgi:2-oxoglutarate ferredoxin oxidoreductase subunit alpha
MQDTVNICIGGEAGQGLDTMGQLLCKALVRSGYKIVVSQSYLSRIRGGHNSFSIRVSTENIQAAQEQIDLLIALNEECVEKHKDMLSDQGLVLLDAELQPGEVPHLGIPFKDLVSKKIYENVLALGVVAAILGIKKDILIKLIQDTFGKKKPQVTQENEEALQSAYEWFAKQKLDFSPLPALEHAESMLTLNGNQAIALGAMAGGVKFCSFYPMTPATGVALNLISNADSLGIVVEQAEDEIAAINMALGASFAGGKSIVPTSGGGFALMSEGVSLAAMTETPVTIVLAQRPGPATGLPTRTEQGDLDLVLGSGHGEFPRAVFAPGKPEECFHLTYKALDLAERYQGPTFVMTDQFQADSYRAVKPFDLQSLPQMSQPRTSWEGAEEYERFQFTDSGVSPRLVPGFGEYLVVADSDEHTPDGHITEDHQVRVNMVQKRLQKEQGIREEVVPPTLDQENAKGLLLVCWGSSQGAVQEAAAMLREEGREAATLHFSQVWPLVADHFLPLLQSAEQVVSVESNAKGQMASLVRRESGFEIKHLLLRYDGLPLTPEYIMQQLKDLEL